MVRAVFCPHCKSMINEDILKERNSESVCLVCGKSLLSDEETVSQPEKKETKKYYYYEDGSGNGSLTDVIYERPPRYTFDATDEDDAMRQLREVMPNCSLLRPQSSDKVTCPYCGSTEIQIIQKKYSLFTGFATNDVDRVCVKCKRKF